MTDGLRFIDIFTNIIIPILKTKYAKLDNFGDLLKASENFVRTWCAWQPISSEVKIIHA